jgi:hypothetical protein
VPFDCRYRAAHGPDVCLTSCAATELTHTFAYARVDRPDGVPPSDPRVLDVALLDMHHGWPNLGHDALVHAIQNQVCDIREDLQARRMVVRVLSYDVRRGHAIPEPPGSRHEVYVGTGGPGHLDPSRNDGRDPGSQGIAEDGAWEPRLFRLFDAIARHDSASLFGVCHTFGVMCRWLGVADAVLRAPSKGGKSAGIVENVLTAGAVAHPWFRRFASQLNGTHFPVLDSRLYDLIPHGPLGDLLPLAYETTAPGGPAGEALTMLEVARPTGDEIPRILAVNHHPEIVNRRRQLTVLQKKYERGEVTEEWYLERFRTLEQQIADPQDDDRSLKLTSSYTLLAPLRVQLYRAVLRRAAVLGEPLAFDQSSVPLVYDPVTDRASPLS